MDELLKAKYYKLINTKDFNHYEIVGKVLSEIENMLIQSNNHVAADDLIAIASSLKGSEVDVYDELIKDINGHLLGENDHGR